MSFRAFPVADFVFFTIMLFPLVFMGMVIWESKDGPPPPKVDHLVSLYTDAGTGCQYVGPPQWDRASLTPRIASDGKTHMGCGKQKEPTP